MNNNKNEKPFSLKGKGAAVGIVICFVAVIVMVGTFTFNNYQKKLDKQLAKAEEQAKQLTKEKSEAAAANDIVLPEAESNTSTENDTKESEGQPEDNTGSTDNSTTAGAAADVWFGEGSTLAWPASGVTLIGYSMDKTVYFPTLEQYKYNPAMIIGGKAGETIAASAAGTVTNIEQKAQTGVTVTLDMGNGYSAVYGQLKEVPLQIGDYVAQGATVGYLSEPTKYYSVEGANLYFEILKDGTPVDPLDFMQS